MKKLFLTISLKSKLLLLCSIGAFGLFDLIFTIANMANGGGAANVIGLLLSLIIEFTLFGLLAYYLIKDNKKVSNILLIVLLSYYVVNKMFSLYNCIVRFDLGTMFMIASIFDLFAIFAVIAGCIILFVSLIDEHLSKLKNIMPIILLVFCCLSFLVFVFMLIAYIQFGYPFYGYMSLCINYLVIPAFMIFGYLNLFNDVEEKNDVIE